MSRAGPSLAAVAVLAVAAAGLGVLGSAVAQVEDCGPVSLSPGSYDREVSEGGAATIVADVTNDGPVGGQAWVNATPAQGWSVDVEPATFVLNATETKQATLTATPTGSTSSSSPYEMAVTAELDCSVAGVGSAGTARTEETISLTVQDPGDGSGSASGSSSPLLSGPGLGLVLLGSVALLSVVGYPVVRRRRRGRAVEASVDDPVKRVGAGKGVTFRVDLGNPGDEARTYDVELVDVPDAWSGFVAVPEARVEPGASQGVEVLVRAPESGTPGDRGQVRIEVRRQGGAAETFEFAAHVSPE
jgi:hypothetical protein